METTVTKSAVTFQGLEALLICPSEDASTASMPKVTNIPWIHVVFSGTVLVNSLGCDKDHHPVSPTSERDTIFAILPLMRDSSINTQREGRRGISGGHYFVFPTMTAPQWMESSRWENRRLTALSFLSQGMGP